MFDRLTFSRPPSFPIAKAAPATMWAVGLHAGAAAIALHFTSSIAEPPALTPRVDSIVWIAVPRPHEPNSTTNAAPSQLPVLPPLQAPAVPNVAPYGIPPIDVGADAWPDDWLQAFTTPGITPGVFQPPPLGVRAGPYDVAAVDEPPERLSGPDVHYPSAFERAGVEGAVLLEFVVDSTGIVVPTSIHAIQATHEGFVREAVEAVRDSRFRPGRVRGRPVAVLVRQAVTFVLQRPRGE
jgi:periplasmic protein TonB